MRDRRTTDLRKPGPIIVIVLNVEGRPKVYSSATNASERARVFAWVESRESLAALLKRAFALQDGVDEHEHEDDEDIDHWADDEGPCLVVKSYWLWPDLTVESVEWVPSDWLADLGIASLGGTISGWDVTRFPFDPDAEPDHPTYRPSAEFAPSLGEIEHRLEAEEADE